MNKGLVFVLAGIFLATLSCKKKKDNYPAPQLKGSLQFKETHCSDPWYHDLRTGGDFEARLNTWLTTKTGAPLTRLYRHQSPQSITCESCGCHNGSVIYVWTTVASEQKFLDIGFTRY